MYCSSTSLAIQKVLAKVSQRNRSALEPDNGLDHYSGRTIFAFCRLHMFIND